MGMLCTKLSYSQGSRFQGVEVCDGTLKAPSGYFQGIFRVVAVLGGGGGGGGGPGGGGGGGGGAGPMGRGAAAEGVS